MQLAMRADAWHKLLVSLHIAASAGVLGADLGLLALGLASLGGADPAAIYPAAHLLAGTVVTPLALTALASGVLLGLTTRWGLVAHWWVTIKLVIVLVLTGAVLFVLVPGLEATAEAVTRAGAQELGSGRRLPLVLAPAAASVLLFAALILAVFKPWGRIRKQPADRQS